MISRVNLNSKYLTGYLQALQDYEMRPTPKYIEIRTGHVCDPAYRGSLYCRYTGRARTKIEPKQYLRISAQEYQGISQGRWGRLEYDMYKHLLNDSTYLQLPTQ